jgi:oligopeptide/dipeptide ABC transporter ATP-binding protein
VKAHILAATNLAVYFQVKRSGFSYETIKAVDKINIYLKSGEIFGLVGESGCGKSTTAKALVKLIPITGGSIRFSGIDLVKLTGRRLREKRREIQMIFQDPFASLNPRMTAVSIIAEPLINFEKMNSHAAQKRALELMHTVALDWRLAHCYPHELSGGQRQRIAIARALAAQPKLVICDEPLSALDVSIQAQIIHLLLNLRARLDLAMLFISHDLAVVKQVADQIAVMYNGRIVEQASCKALFDNPRHPYTRQLLAAAPNPDPANPGMKVAENPFPSNRTSKGCAFALRCPVYREKCSRSIPRLKRVQKRHSCACLLISGV